MEKEVNSGDTTARIFKGEVQESFLSKIEKASKPTAVAAERTRGVGDYIPRKYKYSDLKQIVQNSSVLPQCIEAYSTNIAGHGIEIKTDQDLQLEDLSGEALEEYNNIKKICEEFSLDSTLEDLLDKVITDREICGSGFIEVERDGMGLPVRLYYVDPKYVEISKVSEPVKYTTYINGNPVTGYKRFRTYRQRILQLSGSTDVYFKEFGDPRTINLKDGKVSSTALEDAKTANEIIQVKVGDGVYGTPRWLGQSVHIQGSRMAEELNFRYFTNGRHVNLAILVEGGTLTKQAYDELQNYMSSVKGLSAAYQTLLIEMAPSKEKIDLSDKKSQKPSIKIEKLNDLTQDDGLFLNYTEDSRQKTQSAFRLPDIYVGRSKEYNMSTAKASIEITERQVFKPCRKTINWILNTLLLGKYQFKHCSLKLAEPTITDQETQVAFFNAVNAAGGVTPEDARRVLENVLGKNLKNFDEAWAKIPMPILVQQASVNKGQDNGTPTGTPKVVADSKTFGNPPKIAAND